jgi:hypothetical protein
MFPGGLTFPVVFGFTDSDGLAFDSAGNLYVADYGGIGAVSKYSGPVQVPFALRGTATAGVVYDALSFNPMKFPIRETTDYIRGMFSCLTSLRAPACTGGSSSDRFSQTTRHGHEIPFAARSVEWRENGASR